MRGEDGQQSHMFSYVSAERWVPKDHPLRTIWVLSEAALQKLSGRFAELYSKTGRPSIAPEKLLGGSSGTIERQEPGNEGRSQHGGS